MPLQIHIATGSTAPIYRQIIDQICRAIATGGLAYDDQLPSVRALAEQLVINPNTVARAYGELVHDGVVEARKGRGVFVTRRRQIYTRAERRRRLNQAMDTAVGEALFLQFSPQEIRQMLDQKLREWEPPSSPEGDNANE